MIDDEDSDENGDNSTCKNKCTTQTHHFQAYCLWSEMLLETLNVIS